MLKRLGLIGLALTLVALSGTERLALAADGDAAADFRSVKGAIQQLLRSKKPDGSDRRARTARKISGARCRQTGISVGTKDDSTEVREAAYNTLGVIADNEQVGKFLLDSVEREMRRKEPGDASIPLLGALLASKSERAFHDAAALLDKMVETTPGARPDGRRTDRSIGRPRAR